MGALDDLGLPRSATQRAHLRLRSRDQGSAGSAARSGYDDEVLYLGCLLHDVGLAEQGDRDQRFEVDGADLAVQFLAENGVPRERADVVWDAIAWHTSSGIASRKRPEIALLHAGTAIDITGGPKDLPPFPPTRTSSRAAAGDE